MMRLKVILSVAAILTGCALSAQNRIVKDFTPVCDSVSVLLSEKTGVEGELKLKNIMRRKGILDFYFTVSLSDFPWREADYRWFRTTLRSMFPEGYGGYRLGEIYCKREKAESLIVNDLGYDGEPVGTRYRTADPRGSVNPIAVNPDKESYPEGLSGRHIAIWPSHGRYYDQGQARWCWQRPQLFQSVEDMLSTGFVHQWLTPMLENAGGYVMLPRERDTCPVEIIIDNDPMAGGRGSGSYSETGIWEDAGTGFADTARIYTALANPFTAGTARSAVCTEKGDTCRARWTPDIPTRGYYAVYVSYRTLPESSSSALYRVRHLGGTSRFIVNQQIGGGTWIYLGTFEFAEGNEGYVELLSTVPEGRKTARDRKVCADAVKIGGGMGNIARSVYGDSLSVPETSGLPRYAEAARYWLQWAGMDSTVFSHHGLQDDYRDDLFSRGDWVDFMSGGSHINPGKEGKGIPFDLTFAFHTDAGIAQNDSIIGTLGIYTRTNERKDRLPAGEDRLTSREFADIVQSQVVHDLQACIDTSWTRRQIWDRAYRESRTPPCPTILLENFSHQNFADMRNAMDPSFRFILGRAIYKGMLKYLSNRYDCSYTVQPLPVSSLSAVFIDSLTVDLSWLPQKDLLEPTATADGYILYTRKDDGGFDNGRKADTWTGDDGRVHTSVTIVPGHIYSYRVSAVNRGGESFPSETLSAGLPEGKLFRRDSAVLVVNNFTRVSAPAWFDTAEMAGFMNTSDPGMPYIRDISYTGDMYEFRKSSQFRSNAFPGFGASYGEHAGRPVTGNTFDYTYIHGKAIMEAGYAFCSTSACAFASDSTLSGRCTADSTATGSFFAADIICGEQVTTLTGKKGSKEKYRIFPDGMQSAIIRFTSGGGNILISGSHISTDIWDSIFPVETDSTFRESSIRFAEDILGFRWVTGHASKSRTAAFLPARDSCTVSIQCGECSFSGRDGIYTVTSPDGIVPASGDGRTISEYTDTGIPCGICHSSPSGYRTVCFGFPLETLSSEESLHSVISSILKYFRQ